MRWFTLLMLLPCWVMAQNYCSICKDHTMCKYQRSGPTCGSSKGNGVSQAEIQQILQSHNYFRAKIATGRENRGCPGPQPPAANMQELVWDDNLAAVAQKWADQCILQHDACRDDPRFQVGQNMYFSSGFSEVNWTRAISSWYEEVTRFNSRMVDSFQFQPAVGHYTQLLWGKTRYVGCGRVTFGGAYRLAGYQRMEYVLSSSPRNETDVDFEDENRRGFDIRPDLDDILTTVPDIIEDLEEQVTDSFTTIQDSQENTFDGITTEKIISTTSGIKEEEITKPSTTTQTSEENISSETTIANSTENIISITSGIKEDETAKPSTTTLALEKNASGETTTEKIILSTSGRKEEKTTKSSETQAEQEATENSTKNIDQLALKNKVTPPTKNSSRQNPKFTIFIPDYWISDSGLNLKGPISGTFQSLKLAQPWDLSSFVKETHPLEALKITSWDSVHGRWYLTLNPTSSNSARENPPRIQMKKFTENGWVQSNFGNLGRDQILVCNYGPAGNYLYKPIYIRGQPCSRCPDGSVCRNGLCAQG